MKWREYLNRHGDSVVADIFEGQFQSAMKCGECNKVLQMIVFFGSFFTHSYSYTFSSHVNLIH